MIWLVLVGVGLLFVLINLAIALYLGSPAPRSTREAMRRDHRRRADEVVKQFGLDFFRRLYPGKSTREIKRLIYSQKGFRTVYEPFVETRTAAVVDPTMNVHAAGFRLVGEKQGPWPLDPEAINVVVFGSSTTVSWALCDEDTMPAAAQRLVRARLVRDDINFYNFAVSAHFSTQEVLYMQNLLRDGARPDIVIMIDGPNEFHFWHGESALSARHRDADAEIHSLREQLGRGRGFRWHFVELLASLPVVELVRRRAAINRAAAAATSLEPGAASVLQLARASDPGDIYASLYDDGQEITNRHRLDRVIERYFVNKEIAHAIANAFAIEPVFVWQPTPVYKYDLTLHPYRIPDDQRRARYGFPLVRQCMEDGKTGTGFLWCGDIFEKIRTPMYADHVHYNADGCAALAQAIVDNMLRLGVFDRVCRRKMRESCVPFRRTQV